MRKNSVNLPVTTCFRCVCFRTDSQVNGRACQAADSGFVVGQPLQSELCGVGRSGSTAAERGAQEALRQPGHTPQLQMGRGSACTESGSAGLRLSHLRGLLPVPCQGTCPHLACRSQLCTGTRQISDVISHELQGSARTQQIAGQVGPCMSVCLVVLL